jgi:hypothetical protein
MSDAFAEHLFVIPLPISFFSALSPFFSPSIENAMQFKCHFKRRTIESEAKCKIENERLINVENISQ